MMLKYQLCTGGGGKISLVTRRLVGIGLYRSPHPKPGGLIYSCEREFTSPIDNVDIPVRITPNYCQLSPTGARTLKKGTKIIIHLPAAEIAGDHQT
jgi:hypothetical protein